MARKSESLLLDTQLCFALYSATNAVIRAYRPLLQELDLTYPQYLALLVLWEKDGLSVRDLGARLGLDSGTLTPMLKRMEKSGLVERQRTAADERQLAVTLTKAGKALRSRALHVPDRLAKQFGRPRLDREKLRDELKSLLETLEPEP